MLDVIDDEDVREGHDRSAISAQFKKGPFFTASYQTPEDDGLAG
jgi:hypothetical protein